MEIIGVVLFYGLIFAGIAAMRRWAWADVDEWRSQRRTEDGASKPGRNLPASSEVGRFLRGRRPGSGARAKQRTRSPVAGRGGHRSRCWRV